MISRINSLFLRNIRIGVSPQDLNYLDPTTPLYATPGDEFACSDDPLYESPVLERNNVGMGLLLLNTHNGTDELSAKGYCEVYKRLRNLEVNSYKKFVALTSTRRESFSAGLPLKDILAFAESTDSEIPSLALNVLRNQQNLAFLFHSYHKPFISLASGSVRGSGASLCCLANMSCAYENSTMEFGSLIKSGWILTGGLSYILSTLRGSLGLYLALSGYILKGPDLIWTNLCKYWMSPEAIKFLEITSDNQLSLSEADASKTLFEHFLDPPHSYSLQKTEKIIHDIFHTSQSLPDLTNHLLTQTPQDTSTNASFLSPYHQIARTLLDSILSLPPLSAQISFKLIKKLQAERETILRDAGVDGSEWNNLLEYTRRRRPHTPKEVGMHRVVEACEERIILRALRWETKAAEAILKNPVTKHIIGTSLLMNPENCDIRQSEIDSIIEEIFHKEHEPLPPPPRSDIPLSAFMRIRKTHPDFDPTTSLDYDPLEMASLLKEWDGDRIERELRSMERQLGFP